MIFFIIILSSTHLTSLSLYIHLMEYKTVFITLKIGDRITAHLSYHASALYNYKRIYVNSPPLERSHNENTDYEIT